MSQLQQAEQQLIEQQKYQMSRRILDQKEYSDAKLVIEWLVISY